MVLSFGIVTEPTCPPRLMHQRGSSPALKTSALAAPASTRPPLQLRPLLRLRGFSNKQSLSNPALQMARRHVRQRDKEIDGDHGPHLTGQVRLIRRFALAQALTDTARRGTRPRISPSLTSPGAGGRSLGGGTSQACSGPLQTALEVLEVGVSVQGTFMVPVSPHCLFPCDGSNSAGICRQIFE